MMLPRWSSPGTGCLQRVPKSAANGLRTRIVAIRKAWDGPEPAGRRRNRSLSTSSSRLGCARRSSARARVHRLADADRRRVPPALSAARCSGRAVQDGDEQSVDLVGREGRCKPRVDREAQPVVLSRAVPHTRRHECLGLVGTGAASALTSYVHRVGDTPSDLPRRAVAAPSLDLYIGRDQGRGAGGRSG